MVLETGERVLMLPRISEEADSGSLPRRAGPESSSLKNLDRTPPKELSWSGAMVVESHEGLKGKWKDHPTKSLRVECPKDKQVAWLNHNGVLICSAQHIIYNFLTKEDLDKLGEIKVA